MSEISKLDQSLILRKIDSKTINIQITNNSMLMVFCDRDYEYKDYIENYKDFLKIIRK